MYHLTRFMLLLFFLISLPAHAYRIIAPEIANSLTMDGASTYNKVLNEILRRSGESPEVNIYPLARAIIEFDKDPQSCFYPASIKTAKDFLNKEFVDTGSSINKFVVVAAYSSEDKTQTPIAQFENIRVAALLGDDIEVYGLPTSKMNIEYVKTHDQSVAMLKSGRVGAIIGPVSDLWPYRQHLVFDVTSPLYSAEESIVCHKGAKLEPILEKFRRAIISMKKDGTMKELFSDFYYVPDEN